LEKMLADRSAQNHIKDLESKLDEKSRLLAMAREEVYQYGQHLRGCSLMFKTGISFCDCGYKEILAKIDGEEK